MQMAQVMHGIQVGMAPQGAIAALLEHAADGIQVPVSAHLT
jgi:hypothetical protein